ncbi:AVAST type 2 anti-phage system protein Avs2 [Telluribacter humicola]|uniref:AVAST type 2 anti-phage system protein Avs2 n=1 Tax=Telluribacter humicola TaxID=1720261 RepID=UPI001A965626|nr:AVAST type 2 anti-phage system protein Avs2 [Telluribacter humicola]
MDPVLITIITYVSLKFVDQFIKDEGYGRIKKFLFPSEKYANRLTDIIYETIKEYQNIRPIASYNNKFPFYYSQSLFDELNKFIIFKNSDVDYNAIASIIDKNPNIIVPNTKDLETFYHIFTSKVNKDKTLRLLYIDENFKSKIFTLGKDLERIEGKVDLINSNVQDLNSEILFHPHTNWLLEQCRLSIFDLGKRYTLEINVHLEVSEIFEGLGRTEEFKIKVENLFDMLLIKGKKVLEKESSIKEWVESLENYFDELYNLFNNTDFLGTSTLPVDKIRYLINNIESSVQHIRNYYIEEEIKLHKEKDDHRYYHKYGLELRNIQEFKYELSNFNTFIRGSTFNLANNPFLLLDGEAGIGKSHLIGDIVSSRNNRGYESIFLLGQHFVTDEDPWTQIFKRLQINSKSEDFLRKLNQHADKSRKRIILFIDAINEGRGNYFWSSFIRSFINEIRRYEWLGLVITVRSSYKNYIFPEDELLELRMVEHHHYGFKNIEYEASKLFFDNYKIELPNVPLLNPEFQNPLFLKLFCEGINKAGLTRIPDGLQGITSINNFFIKNVNNVLSKPNRLGYSTSLNLVEKSIYVLIEYKIKNNLEYIPYEKAYEVIDNNISKFITRKGFIDELITEGVLSKNLFWRNDNDYEEGVYLAYQRFEDHLTVQYLLDQCPKLDSAFKKGGKLYKYVKDQHALYIHKGLVEAFSIQVPEKTGQEFFAHIPELKDEYPIIESFVESLLWRKIETINEISQNYVNEYVISYNGTYELFLETILAITGVPGHFFNANSLHAYLLKFSLAERDANWTQFLKYRYSDDSSVKRLIDWAWNDTDKSHISDQSILLSGITLAWFHTSTNRKLRDCSTKALVSLLQYRLNILIDILKMFENVNDPYISERLYAVAYGCALRTQQKESLADLSEYIFSSIFNNPQGVVPHILMRDYARGVIEYTHHLGINLSFEISKIRPPYKSAWPEEIPSYDELEENYNNDKYWHLWESIMGLGDFSRYIIGTNNSISDWSGCKKGETPINREQLYYKFKNKLNNDQLQFLNALDPIITSDEPSRTLKLVDRKIDFKIAIGRKSEEQLTQIRTDFKQSLSKELLSEYENEIEPFLNHNHKIINTGEYFDLRVAQRLIFSKVINLGWNPELHLAFDKEIGTGRNRDTNPHERIGKKYQWIAYHQYMSLLSDNFIKKDRWGDREENPYQGPWDPYVRDIDPSILINKTGRLDEEQSKSFWWDNNEVFNWNSSNDDWVQDSTILPRYEELIQVKDNNDEEWLILEAYPSWSEPKKIGEEKWNQPRKELWSQIRSYIVNDSEFIAFKDWASKQDFMGRWMPESHEQHEMFSREYYWSPAQEYFMNERNMGTEWIELHDKKSGKFVTKVNITSQAYSWGEEYDMSKEESIYFLKPSKLIYEGMRLKYSQNEGEFLNTANEVQCFAPNVYNSSKPSLLIKKKPFLNWLQEHNLKIAWTCLGEKLIIGGSTFGKDYSGRLEISGVYYLDNCAIVGRLNLKQK